MALRRDWIPSPNYSSRGGTPVRLVVVHTAEGALTYQSLGSFFANPASGVSSQTGIDDTPGVIGEYVTRTAKPWTQGNANPYSTATELCAFAAWTRTDWLQHDIMLDNCRRWIEEECAHFGIPRVKLSAAQAQGGVAGVCGHVDLGAAGGGHWDPGPDFPWDIVLSSTPPGPVIPPAPPDLHFASGQEDAQVALTTGPDGSRVDLLFVAADSSVHHWWANSPEDLGTDHGWAEALGGAVRPGGGVSGGWTADKRSFVVTIEGTDNRPHKRISTGGRWDGWRPVGPPGTLRD